MNDILEIFGSSPQTKASGPNSKSVACRTVEVGVGLEEASNVEMAAPTDADRTIFIGWLPCGWKGESTQKENGNPSDEPGSEGERCGHSRPAFRCEL